MAENTRMKELQAKVETLFSFIDTNEQRFKQIEQSLTALPVLRQSLTVLPVMQQSLMVLSQIMETLHPFQSQGNILALPSVLRIHLN